MRTAAGLAAAAKALHFHQQQLPARLHLDNAGLAPPGLLAIHGPHVRHGRMASNLAALANARPRAAASTVL